LLMTLFTDLRNLVSIFLWKKFETQTEFYMQDIQILKYFKIKTHVNMNQ
jgi:hypothetical protein